MSFGSLVLAYGAVALLGGIVAACELIARYKDAPQKALFCAPAILYVGVSLALSIFALYCIRLYAPVTDNTAEDKVLSQVLMAGVGAMAFFRTSLFSIRAGETDIAIGPAAFAQIILDAADRAIDRERASPRATSVQKIMTGVNFDKAVYALPTFCFALMQNVPADQQKVIAQQLESLKAVTNIDDSVKVMTLGLLLMNLAGEELLQDAVTALGNSIK